LVLDAYKWKMAMGLVPDRRVQARSTATRQALLDAAIESLVERGYAATTTIETARRAGVSRGAQQHHFPTKALLVTAAVEHLLTRRLAEFRAAFAAADTGGDRLDVAVDLAWSMFQSPAFAAWIELWVAARTDPELAATMIDIDRRFTDETRTMFLELFPPDDRGDPALFDIGRDFAFAVMTGVALQRLVPRGQRPAGEYLDALKQMFRMLGA
jgi:AcrR family transcriptional regulator